MISTKKKTATTIVTASLLSTCLIAPQPTEAAGYYYWHNGDMDDSTVLNKTFRNAVKSNNFTYDGVNINTEYSIFKRVMAKNNYAYKKVRNGVFKSRNATFVFSLKNGKLLRTSKLKGIYFNFDDYAISTSQVKKIYGTPASTKSIKNGVTYTYKAHYNIKNKFDFVKTKGKYKLSGFMTTK